MRQSHPIPGIVGRQYTWLTVTGFAGRRGKCAAAYYECRCKCGAMVVAMFSSLTVGDSKSCGCWKKYIQRKRLTTHGQSKTVARGKKSAEYTVWDCMVQRCTNVNHKAFRYYGGRGIKICERLRAFEGFHAVMGDRPDDGKEIDREDNDAHYSCGKCAECRREGWKLNVRWATRSVQMMNRRNTVMLTARGRTLPLLEWAKETRFKYMTLLCRLRRGWTGDKVVDVAPKPTRLYGAARG